MTVQPTIMTDDPSSRGLKSVTPAVQVVDLTKRYDARVRKITSSIEFGSFVSLIRGNNPRTLTVLNKVNFSIAPGEVFGLLGPNGAGKTTLIKILSTLVLPDDGHALVFGDDVVKHPRAVLRKLQAVLAEGWGFERRLSGKQNLQFYAKLYGIAGGTADRRIDELLEFCQLTGAADQMFQKYSTGMARKLLVARALLTDASVLLFDEPTSGLDPVSAADFREFLRRNLVKDKGKTLIWATHNLVEAQQVCERIGVLNKGQIVARGSPSEIRMAIAEKVNMSISVTGGGGQISSDDLSRFSAVPGVVQFGTRRDTETGNLILDIEATRDVDYGLVFDTIKSLHLRITAMEASQPSLEEAFIRLTRGEAK